MSEDEVFTIVEQAVEANQPKKYHLNVLRGGMQNSGSWWYVIVLPDNSDIRAYDYSNRMAKIEHQIERQHNLNVLLVPNLPD